MSVWIRRQLLLAQFLLVSLVFIVGALLPGPFREHVRDVMMLSRVDGYAHLFFIGLMSFLLARMGLRWYLTLLLMLAFGAMIEVVQIWVPGRSPSWQDFFDDGIGALIGIFIALLIPGTSRRVVNG
ncbi:VanZ family protein [Alcanivorax sediminis]|uniref:VanZ family protein n=1 Tax=Alcanivorax sediminis TaxID=2663008 RepID=A0A6N7M2I2_9GAMM|nr:VanZ family protein [Alcanivorax sediminis]MQX54370.1 VanZ family protein [Alcanivorax sediminis]